MTDFILTESESQHATPSKKRLQPEHDSKIQSTPGSAGSVKVAEFNTDVTIKALESGFLEDIHSSVPCAFKDMLAYLLGECMDGSPDIPDPVAKVLKDAVLLCNSTAGLEMRQSLEKYCNTADEVDRYQYFVHFANKGLDIVNSLSIEGFKGPTYDHPWCLFHRNDPNVIKRGNPMDSSCKPDVVLLEFLHAILDPTHQDSQWRDIAFTQALKRPTFAEKRKWTWEHPVSCVEFKKRRPKLPKLPLQWKSDITLVEVGPCRLPPEDGSREDVMPRVSVSSSGTPVAPVATKPRVPVPAQFGPTTRRSASQATSSTPHSGQKRLRDDATEPSSSKRTKTKEPALRSHPVLQTALYAAARLSLSARVSHVINLHIEDQHLFLWYFDHEGAIQTSGLDIVANFPHFLVLLFAFTRFNRTNFGEISEFSFKADTTPSLDENPGHPSTQYPIFATKKYEIELDETERLAPRAPTLRGRDTKVYDLSNTMVKNLETNQLGLHAVAKFSWAETGRVPESEIVANATAIVAEQKPGHLHVDGHIPEVYDSHLFGYDTNTIRIKLKLLSGRSPSNRALVFLMSRRLFPITGLVGERFWRAYWECVNCLYVLYKNGIWHLDVSVSNLMYSKTKKESRGNELATTGDNPPILMVDDEIEFEIRGVLNDYDLARLINQDDDYTPSRERTGTIPFMALDLLTENGWAGMVPRSFRQDLESCMWDLLWVMGRYDGGKETNNWYQKWAVRSHLDALGARSRMWARDITVTPSYAAYKLAAQYVFLVHIKYHEELRHLTDLAPTAPSESRSDEEWLSRVYEAAGKVDLYFPRVDLSLFV